MFELTRSHEKRSTLDFHHETQPKSLLIPFHGYFI